MRRATGAWCTSSSPTTGARACCAKRARGEARRAEIFASLSAGERREAARLLERLAAAVEGLR